MTTPSPEALTLGDPRLADYRDLTDVALRRRTEPAEGLFIAEGTWVVERALQAGYAPRSLLVSCAPAGVAALAMLGGRMHEAGADLYTASEETLEQVTGFHVHRGVLAAFARRPLPDAMTLAAAAERVAVLEDLNNSTNLGAVFRSAAALGVDAILLSPRCGDPLYRRSVRVSMGGVFAVPYARLAPWPQGLRRLSELGFHLVALTPDEGATDLAGYRPRARSAILLGAEGPGLSSPVLALADEWVRIPMTHAVDSLNVAAAAAVTFWALGRG